MNIKEKELTGISGTDEPDDPKIELPFTFGDDEDEDLEGVDQRRNENALVLVTAA